MSYFDHNASAPLHPAAREAWLTAASQFPGNPSSPHRTGQRADHALQDARNRLAALLGCQPTQILWTSGATESNNLVVHHLARSLPPDSEAWISALEHPCITAATHAHFRNRTRILPITPAGLLDLHHVEQQLKRTRPGFIACLAASNLTGILQPWPDLLALCRQHDVPFICDAVQWIGRLPATHLASCTWLTGCAHKFGGPRGIGFVKTPANTPIVPLLHGGPQEYGARAGTENVPGALALVTLLETLGSHFDSIPQRLQLRTRMLDQLQSRLPTLQILGTHAPCLWNTAAVLMPPTDCPQRWVIKLDKLGHAVSTGAACSSGREEPAPALLAMGLAPDQASRMLRLSSGWETTEHDWQDLIDALSTAARDLGAA